MTERATQRETAAPPSAHQTAPSEAQLLEVSDSFLEFRCSECGDCCRGWSVPADRTFQSALEDQLDAEPGAPGIDAFVEPPVPDSVQERPVLRQFGGRCVFHTGGNRCGIHERFGADAKPKACQTYPYRQVTLRGSTSLSLDLSCRAAAELLRGSFPPRTIERRPPLAPPLSPDAQMIPGLPVDPRTRREIETALLDLLAMTHVALEVRLLAGSMLLDDAMIDLDGDDRSPQMFFIELRRDRGELLRDLVRAARAVRPNPVRMYALFARITQLVEQWLVALDLDSGGEFWESTRQLVEHFDVDVESAGWHERATRLSRRLTDAWSARHPEVDDILGSYMWHTWRGRHLSAAYGIVPGYRIQLVRFALARWQAVGFAELGARAPAPDDAIRAVQTVERTFGHLPLLDRFWKRTSTLNWILDSDFATRVVILDDDGDIHDQRAA